eukprot:757076-Hanusia_phi.AAC.5
MILPLLSLNSKTPAVTPEAEASSRESPKLRRLRRRQVIKLQLIVWYQSDGHGCGQASPTCNRKTTVW